MKPPVDLQARLIAVGVIALLIVFVLLAVYFKGGSRADFRNVVGKVVVQQQSADISRTASDAAGQAVTTSGRRQAAILETYDEARALRAAGNGVAAEQRMREQAEQAFARGQCADRRLQREDCGDAASPPTPNR